MSSSEIADKCVELSCMTRDEIVKECLTTSFDSMTDSDQLSPIPEDDSVFTYVPNKVDFVDYVMVLMNSSSNKNAIVKRLMISMIEKHPIRVTRSSKRVIDEEEDEEDKKRPRLNSEDNDRNLPEVLGTTISSSMTCVSRTHFPESRLVYPGIYVMNDNEYILFCVDNGRYSSSWLHNDGVTTLTWATANKDKYRETLEAISESKTVHVFRKITGEVNFRYMGKVFDSNGLNKRDGKINLCVR